MLAVVDVSNVRIETKRLILRPWLQSDLNDFYAYASVEGVGEMAGWSHHKSKEESRKILNSFIEHKKTFALELKETGQVIGSLGIEGFREPALLESSLQGRELGYVLAKEYWGRGLMPEAVNAVIDYCFEALHYDFLLCAHFIRNDQSRRVIEKVGFRYLKEIEHETRFETVEKTKLYVLYNPTVKR